MTLLRQGFGGLARAVAIAVSCQLSAVGFAWAQQATHTDNAAFGFNTERMGPIGCAIDDTASRTGTENAAIVVRCTPLGAQHVNLRNNAGTEIGTPAAPLRTDPTGTTTQPVSGTVTADTELPAVAALADATANPTTTSIAAFPMTFNGVSWDRWQGIVDTELLAPGTLADGTANLSAPAVRDFPHWFNGTTWDRARGTSTDGALVNLGANNDVTVTSGTVTANAGTGTFITDPTNATASDLNAEVQGDAASGAAKSGNPVQVGGVFNTTQPTVTTGQMVEAQSTARGALIVATGVDAFSANIGTFPDNEPFNLAQVGGTATVTGGVAGSQGVGGLAAHDAATVGSPVLAGAQMETIADSAPGTRAGTDGDAVKLASTDGALFVIPTGPQAWQTTNVCSAAVLSGVTVKAAPGAGLSLYVTGLTFSIGAATASSIKITISGGADMWGPHYLEAINGRGVTLTFPTPLKVTANTLFTATSTGATTCTLNTQGFTAPG